MKISSSKLKLKASNLAIEQFSKQPTNIIMTSSTVFPHVLISRPAVRKPVCDFCGVGGDHLSKRMKDRWLSRKIDQAPMHAKQFVFCTSIQDQSQSCQEKHLWLVFFIFTAEMKWRYNKIYPLPLPLLLHYFYYTPPLFFFLL
jgi:hypothetical protein